MKPLSKTKALKHSYHYSLNHDLNKINTLKHQLSHIGLKHQVRPQIVSHLQLCLEELIVNIISYGFVSSKKKPQIEISIHIHSHHIQMEVKDNATAFNPLKHVPLSPQAPTLQNTPLGGVGLKLVKGFMDDIQYSFQTGFNRLTLIKKL